MGFCNDPRRRQWQNPEAILTSVRLNKGDVFIDIGCGDGYFALPAARIVGKEGKIYGVDINRDFVNALEKKAISEGLGNITLKVGRAEDTLFCDSCADFVFFGIDLHDFEEPMKVLSNAWKMLKPSGRVIDLDWKKEHMEIGPPFQKRFSEGKAVELIEKSGFGVESVKNSGSFHYMIVALRR